MARTRALAARGAAGLVLLTALGLGARARWGAEEAAELDMASYRVAYEQPTVEAALWFVLRYPDYVLSGEGEGLGAWLDGLEPGEREFVVAMGTSLAWAWVEHELEHFEGRTPVDLAVEASVLVRHKTLNQLEVPLEPHAQREQLDMLAYAGDPHFATGVLARLLRGASNCEGQNHLVALLLDAALESRGDREIDAELVGVPGGHDITRMSGPGLAQPVFVDAWANLPPFSIDPGRHREAPLLQELGDVPEVLIPRMASATPRPAEAYEGLLSEGIVMVPERGASSAPVSLEIRAPKLGRGFYERVDVWELYLVARVLHVYDDPRAVEAYAYLLDYRCVDEQAQRSFVCMAGARFHRRIVADGGAYEFK